jgi:hypothetical protein
MTEADWRAAADIRDLLFSETTIAGIEDRFGPQ